MSGPNLGDRLREIATDRISGAREIVSRLLHHLAAATATGNDRETLETVLGAARIVVPSQPTLAPLLSGFDALFHAHADGGAAAIRSTLERLLDEQREGLQEAVSRATERLSGTRRVATLSWSSTVGAALERCKEPLEVFVAESRPGAEGRRAAARAAGAGHRVTFTADSAFPGLASRAEVLLLGGDALAPDGLVNKVGSLPAAREVRAAGGRVVAILDRSKILGEVLARRLRILAEPPDEIWPSPPDGVTVENRYFELVPLLLLDAIWGVEGVIAPAEVLAQAAARPPSRFWAEIPPAPSGIPVFSSR